MESSKLARFTRGDKVLVVSAFIALISLFLPWYQASISGSTVGGSYAVQSVSGWGSGYGWFGVLCLVAAGIYVVLQRSDVDLSRVPLGATVTVLSLAGLGTVIVLLRLSTLPSGRTGGGLQAYGVDVSYHYGPAVGIVLALIAGLVEIACAFLMFRRRGNRGVVVTGAQVPDHADETA